MRDLIFIGYSAVWVVLAWSVNRLPFWQPRVVRIGNANFIPDQRPAGCMMLLFLAMGVVIGATLPLGISDVMPHAAYEFRRGGVADLDGLGRLAMIVGGLCGGYVGLRGSRLWVVLMLIGLALYAVSATLGWIIRGF